MASSRWKRFAFFDKQTLNVPTDVWETDLQPQEQLSVCLTTAGLPTSKTTVSETQAAFWKSLLACDGDTTTTTDVSLSSKNRSENNSNSSCLVLVFLGSRHGRIHCFDVTQRATARLQPELDGWRGYFSLNIDDNDKLETITGLSASRLSVSQSQHSVLYLAVLGTTTAATEEGGNQSPSPSSVLIVLEDPHLDLTLQKSPLLVDHPTSGVVYRTSTTNVPSSWNSTSEYSCVDVMEGIVAVGTQDGTIFIYSIPRQSPSKVLRPYLRIPAPGSNIKVTSVQLSLPLKSSNNNTIAHIFCCYDSTGDTSTTSVGICCYDFAMPTNTTSILSAPLSRHDLDGRLVTSQCLVDSDTGKQQITVARPDGLYSYSPTSRTGVAPIDGSKTAICTIPNYYNATRSAAISETTVGYDLVASRDTKSGRDTVDVYDATNKLVAFHLLLSPGHKALFAAGISIPSSSGTHGRSSALVVTSGGSLITFTEKLTEEKIALLVQKNLYSAAIVVAYADQSYEQSDITRLYQKHAEHLYRKGDFSGAMDQYMHTIGSLESSHVIFRYLDAPKIPLLVKYLEQLRSRELATPVHSELLRTCYLKLNDVQAAESIAVSNSRSITDSSLESILTNLTHKPKDALATICSLEAHQAAEVLVVHGASLARVLPRETAGVVIALCIGTYQPSALAEIMSDPLASAKEMTNAAAKMVTSSSDKVVMDKPYPVHLFASAFVEHPKLLRLILAHCNRNKCPLTPSLRRTLLELTLSEWNQAKASGDTEAEKLRHKEAIASLTDSHSRDIGDYDALVIVQAAGFDEGELLLYERLQMTPMLLERYARDGSEKSRRQMLAMCQTDPEVLADVLGHFVEIASEKINANDKETKVDDDMYADDEVSEIMEDVQEALSLARRQGVLPPVRIARILAGEGTGQFSADTPSAQKTTVPLSVALDYVGTILEESRKETMRLKSEIEEYNQLCNSMEDEIDSLLRSSGILPPVDDSRDGPSDSRLNIDDMFARVKADDDSSSPSMTEQAREAFWREMAQEEESFETISRFFAKGVIG